MKSRREAEKRMVKKQGVLHWEFLNPKRSNVIIPEIANQLTNDEQLRKDIVNYHEELIDKRIGIRIEVENEVGFRAAVIDLFGADPRLSEPLSEFIEFSLEGKNYVSEKDIKDYIAKHNFKVDNVTIKNFDEINEMSNMKFKVEFA